MLWSGGNSSCSTKAIWAARPHIQAEDELAETRAAQLVTHRQTQQDVWAANIESDAHLCTFDDCHRAGHDQGFGSSYSSIRHLDSHKAEDNVRDDGYLCQVKDCPWAAPGKGLVSAQALLYHQSSHYHINADSYLCTEPECGRSGPGKGFRDSTHLARHMDSHDRGIAGSQPSEKQTQTSCSDRRCGHVTNPFFYPKHEEQHVDGRFACKACGLRYYHAATANEHALKLCRVENEMLLIYSMSTEVCDLMTSHGGMNRLVTMKKHNSFQIRHVNRESCLGGANAFVRYSRIIKTGSKPMIAHRSCWSSSSLLQVLEVRPYRAQFAHSSGGTINLYKDIVSNKRSANMNKVVDRTLSVSTKSSHPNVTTREFTSTGLVRKLPST